MSDDIKVLPQDLVETVRSMQQTKLVVVHSLLGRPDLTIRPYKTSKPQNWALQRLELRWQNQSSGPGAVTRRGPWTVYSISLHAALRLKSGGVSQIAEKSWGLNKGWGEQVPWSTFGGTDDPYPTPDYVRPMLESMLPFDWDSEYDGVPPWRG